MASIRSVLIKTCMSNIQKEIGQLEHWLLNLPADVDSSEKKEQAPVVHDRVKEVISSADFSRLIDGIDRMSQQLSFQQITLAHITDRIEILENFRDVHIQQKEENSPWLTDAIDLDEEEDDHPIIHVTHLDESNQVLNNVSDTSVTDVPLQSSHDSNEKSEPKEEVASSTVSVPLVVDPSLSSTTDSKAPEVNQPEKKEEVATSVETQEDEPIVQQDAEKEIKVDLEVTQTENTSDQKEEPLKVEEELPKEVEKEQEVEEQEEEEEQEETEELEGTVFEYKDVTYYRDLENHVFAVDENGELSEMAIGFWKEKTQTILFYKMK